MLEKEKWHRMKLSRHLVFVITIITVSVFFEHHALAETSGWMNFNDVERYIRKRFKKKVLLKTVNCKDGPGTKPRIDGAYYKVTFSANPNEKEWIYTMGPVGGFRPSVEGYKRQGYSIAHSDGFVKAKTGLKIYCAVMHRPKRKR
ncbi:MAG: hypothetical protein GY943_15060 [Chloroflexi bacterium]|nr:hypothetical protein [Chloroflexota bacterium]